jgi:hypothetical protein
VTCSFKYDHGSRLQRGVICLLNTLLSWHCIQKTSRFYNNWKRKKSPTEEKDKTQTPHDIYKISSLIRSIAQTICMSMVNDRHLTDESRILSHEGQHGDRSVLTVCIAAKNAGPSQRNTLRFIQQSDGRRLLRLRNAIHSVGWDHDLVGGGRSLCYPELRDAEADWRLWLEGRRQKAPAQVKQGSRKRIS